MSLRQTVLRNRWWGAVFVLTAAVALYRPLLAQTPAKSRVAAPTPAAERALLETYCITCHDDEQKTANFSLQSADINKVGDHLEIWEKVIRKLRAGMMPPPGMPRPPLAQYEQLRDWLENQVDSKAAASSETGRCMEEPFA